MDWNSLPDLLAFAALVAVFSSLLPRKADSSLRLWLAAWILIVAHFGAKFSDASGVAPDPEFDRGSDARPRRPRVHVGGGIATDDVAWPSDIRIDRRSTTGIPRACGVRYGAALRIIWLPLFSDSCSRRLRSSAWSRRCRTVSFRSQRVGALFVSLLLVIRFNSDPANGESNILTWLYLCAGILQWRRADSISTGDGHDDRRFLRVGERLSDRVRDGHLSTTRPYRRHGV